MAVRHSYRPTADSNEQVQRLAKWDLSLIRYSAKGEYQYLDG